MKLYLPALTGLLLVLAICTLSLDWLPRPSTPPQPVADPPVHTARVWKADASPRAVSKQAPTSESVARSAPAAVGSPGSADGSGQGSAADSRKWLLYAPTYHVAKALGWRVDSDLAEYLARWQAVKRQEDRKLLKRVRGSKAFEVMGEFNEKTEARRVDLVAKVGVRNAELICARYPLYRFAMPEGRWHRIGFDGGEVPFEHDDEDLFGDREWRR